MWCPLRTCSLKPVQTTRYLLGAWKNQLVFTLWFWFEALKLEVEATNLCRFKLLASMLRTRTRIRNFSSYIEVNRRSSPVLANWSLHAVIFSCFSRVFHFQPDPLFVCKVCPNCSHYLLHVTCHVICPFSKKPTCTYRCEYQSFKTLPSAWFP
jgi:hypothetical protein